jgi:hypothetical protein
MILLIGQIITTILTAVVSVIALNKDLNSRTAAIQKGALIAKRFIIFISVTTIIISTISYFDSKNEKEQLTKEKKELNGTLAAIRTDNTKLREQLSKNSISQSQLITANQTKSANELNKAASSLKDLINGSDDVPIFTFRLLTDTSLTAYLKNSSQKPVYNLNVQIINFDNLLKCSTKSYNDGVVYDYDCAMKNMIEIPQILSINGKGGYIAPLPNVSSAIKSTKYKFLLVISLKNKLYYEEAICKIFNNQQYQSIRVLETIDSKIIKKWVVKDKQHPFIVFNWDTEFPLTLPIHIRKI